MAKTEPEQSALAVDSSSTSTMSPPPGMDKLQRLQSMFLELKTSRDESDRMQRKLRNELTKLKEVHEQKVAQAGEKMQLAAKQQEDLIATHKEMSRLKKLLYNLQTKGYTLNQNQDLVDLGNELESVQKRNRELEQLLKINQHNLRTSQFREDEATVFLRRFRSFYYLLWKNTAVKGSGGYVANRIRPVAAKAEDRPMGLPDVNTLVDFDRLMVQSGLLEEDEVGKETSDDVPYKPTPSALTRSALAADEAWHNANKLPSKVVQVPLPLFSTKEIMSAVQGRHAPSVFDGRQKYAGSPAGRSIELRERNLEQQIAEAAEKNKQLKKQLDVERVKNLRANVGGSGATKSAIGGPDEKALQRDLERKDNDLKTLVAKLRELCLVTGKLNDTVKKRDMHIAYLEAKVKEGLPVIPKKGSSGANQPSMPSVGGLSSGSGEARQELDRASDMSAHREQLVSLPSVEREIQPFSPNLFQSPSQAASATSGSSLAEDLLAGLVDEVQNPPAVRVPSPVKDIHQPVLGGLSAGSLKPSSITKGSEPPMIMFSDQAAFAGIIQKKRTKAAREGAYYPSEVILDGDAEEMTQLTEMDVHHTTGFSRSVAQEAITEGYEGDHEGGARLPEEDDEDANMPEWLKARKHIMDQRSFSHTEEGEEPEKSEVAGSEPGGKGSLGSLNKNVAPQLRFAMQSSPAEEWRRRKEQEKKKGGKNWKPATVGGNLAGSNTGADGKPAWMKKLNAKKNKRSWGGPADADAGNASDAPPWEKLRKKKGGGNKPKEENSDVPEYLRKFQKIGARNATEVVVTVGGVVETSNDPISQYREEQERKKQERDDWASGGGGVSSTCDQQEEDEPDPEPEPEPEPEPVAAPAPPSPPPPETAPAPRPPVPAPAPAKSSFLDDSSDSDDSSRKPAPAPSAPPPAPAPAPAKSSFLDDSSDSDDSSKKPAPAPAPPPPAPAPAPAKSSFLDDSSDSDDSSRKPAAPAPASAKPKRSFLDDSSDEESSDSPVVRAPAPAPARRSFLDDSDSDDDSSS